MGAKLAALRNWLFLGTSPATLGLFRIVMGIGMTIQVIKIMDYTLLNLLEQKFFITYDFFHWVTPVGKAEMSIILTITVMSAILVGLGFLYRIAIVLQFLGWTYFFLICRGHYNNHYYLYCLLSFLMIWMPANRWGSLDRILLKSFETSKRKVLPWWEALLKKLILLGGGGPSVRDQMPQWPVRLLQAQLVIVYFYGAIAKLNWDWLHGYPMRIWLDNKAGEGPLGDFLRSDAAAYFFSYGGIVFDATIGFLLLWKKTRWFAMVPLVFFHVTNAVFWDIGTFPWFMLLATALFFEPEWPETVLSWVRRQIPGFGLSGEDGKNQHERNQSGKEKEVRGNRKDKARERLKSQGEKASEVRRNQKASGNGKLGEKERQKVGRKGAKGASAEREKRNTSGKKPTVGKYRFPKRPKLVFALIAMYLIWQILFPFRHWFYPGNTAWHGQGNLFAWRMLLVDRSDAIKIRVALPGQGTIGYVKMEEYINARQFKRMSRMPKAYHRFALFLKEEMKQNATQALPDPEIYVYLRRSLNGRHFQFVIDSTVNLAGTPYSLTKDADYIIPLDPNSKPGENYQDR